MEDELKTGFEGLDEILGTKFEEAPTTEESTDLVARTELVEMAKKDKSIEEEREFLAGKIAELMAEAKDVAKVLKSDIKIGTKASMYEVYSTLSNTILECIKEMNKLTMNKEKLKLEREKFEHKVSKSNQPNVNVKASLNLSSADLFKMMEEAKKGSSLNSIDADYTVVNERTDEDTKLNKEDRV